MLIQKISLRANKVWFLDGYAPTNTSEMVHKRVSGRVQQLLQEETKNNHSAKRYNMNGGIKYQNLQGNLVSSQ